MSFDPNTDWHHDEDLRKRNERRPPLFWWALLAIAGLGILFLVISLQ